MRKQLFVSVCLVTSACAVSGQSEPKLSLTEPIVPGDPITLPMDAYLASGDSSILLSNLRDRLIRDCMAERGFDYPVIVRRRTRFGDHQRRYGITDSDLASESGYRPPLTGGDLVSSGTSAQVAKFYNELSEAGGLALMGPDTESATYSPDSCFGLAQDELELRDVDAQQEWVDELLARARTRFESDSRVAEANKDWSECMARLGYEYADPLVVGDDPRWSGDVDEIEIRVAVHDIECKQRTDYLTQVVAVESAYQQEVIEAESERLSQIADDTLAAIDAARRVESSFADS